MSDETYLMIPFEMMIGEWMRVDVRMLLHVSTLSPLVAHASSGKRKSVRRRKKKKTALNGSKLDPVTGALGSFFSNF